jgi:hypothetical protein
VIVGPSRNQDKNFTKALELLGSGIKIERSDTPFIEELPSNRRQCQLVAGRFQIPLPELAAALTIADKARKFLDAIRRGA